MIPDKLSAQLAKARAEITAMEQSKTLEELEEHWKEFLSQLERVWYKTNACFARSPGWKKWVEPYAKQRNDDKLLRYLGEARGRHEHTVEDITAKKPGKMSIAAGPTGSGIIRGISIVDGKLDVEMASGSAKVKFSPGNVRLLPITKREGSIPIPRSHRGDEIDPEDIIELARHGYDFYEQLVRSAADR